MITRGSLYLEERVNVAYEMLNRSVRLYDGLRLSEPARRRLDSFTRQTMLVLIGERAGVPRDMRDRIRPVRRARR